MMPAFVDRVNGDNNLKSRAFQKSEQMSRLQKNVVSRASFSRFISKPEFLSISIGKCERRIFHDSKVKNRQKEKQ